MQYISRPVCMGMLQGFSLSREAALFFLLELTCSGHSEPSHCREPSVL